MAPVDVLNRLKSYYATEPPQRQPAISPQSAAAISIAFTLLYVVPFYVFKATRPSPQLSRDAPSSIRARIRAVTFATTLASLISIYAIARNAGTSPTDTFRLLGWWPASLLDVAKTILLVAILFAGPLFEAGAAEGQWRYWIRGSHIGEVLGSWIGWRNFVVGPMTEELIWRSLIIPLHLLAKVSPTKIVFITPLYFGIAHVHHYYEFRLTHPHTPALPALLRSLFQFTYTSLFGFFAAFVFLRTGNVYGVILAHSFCNWMGLPRFWGRIGVEAGVPIGPPEADGRLDNAPEGRAAGGSLGITWTLAYYSLLVCGAVGFWMGLRPLTESPRALARI